jgi:hypothetical protein
VNPYVGNAMTFDQEYEDFHFEMGAFIGDHFNVDKSTQEFYQASEQAYDYFYGVLSNINNIPRLPPWLNSKKEKFGGVLS